MSRATTQPVVSLEPTAATSLAESAYRQLRRNIITCRIEPGALVTETQLALELGVGKTPTREALARLVAERFVSPLPRRGYAVTPITIAGVLEIFEAFAVIAPEVAALVTVRASTEEREQLLEETERWTPSPTNQAELIEGTLAHFVALTGNPTVIEMASGVIGHMERIFNFTLLQGGLTEESYKAALKSALAALANDDPDLARTEIRRLSEAGKSSVLSSLQRAPSLMTTPVALARPPQAQSRAR